ncbi:acyl carrier protein [Streptomonospora salina]|uniref:Acyl carrier protein n=1 Tax=Streptomonospora salina TaxID=104205 RepID=A0A841EJP1_9ACTN|nr:acyl carrier protein [Streptomonospora salina]MBB6001008.1 acyl carrier protein [Streptomonospora salina]
MNSRDDLLRLIDTELALALAPEHLDVEFDRLDGWDSVHLVRLIAAVERETGRALDVSAALQARTLADFFDLAAGDGRAA